MSEKPAREELQRKVREPEEISSGRTDGETTLREARNRYHGLFMHVPVGLYRTTPDGIILDANPAMKEILSYPSLDALKAVNTAEMVLPPYRKGLEELLERQGTARGFEMQVRRFDGTVIWVRHTVRAVRDEEGGLLYYEGSLEDITDRKNSEAALHDMQEKLEKRVLQRTSQLMEANARLKEEIENRKEVASALKESEEKYRLLVENQTDLIVTVDNEGKFLFVSPSYCEMFGKREKDLVGKTYIPMVHEEDRDDTVRAITRTYRPPHTCYIEQRARTKDGWRWLAWADKAVLNDRGDVVAIVGVGRDVTELKEAEEALKKEKERFQTLVEESPLGVSLISKDGRYIYVNPKFTEIFGYTPEEVPDGRTWFNRAYPDPLYRKKVIATWIQDHGGATAGEAIPRTFNVTCKDGTHKVIHFRSVTLSNGERLIIYEDRTEKRRLEAQLLQAQRMEATGTLAGGIAHDFNNLLMGIQGNASLMLLDLDPGHPHYERLKNIEQYVQSGADLTRQLLGFAKGGKYEVKSVDLNDLVRRTSRMFGRTKKEITIHERYGDPLPAVDVDQGQIEQVLVNLYLNAWQAMPGGGELYLETESLLLQDDSVRVHHAEPGRYVKISVTDTGVGMDAATRRRIFDPFFTTKDMGRGTGLGLASAYGIIRNHGGFISVYSKRGHGSTFNIYLPASGTILEKNKPPAQELVRGTETLLIVDDEEMIIKVGTEMLRTLGYKVLSAANGGDAIESYRGLQEEIALVILDMIMPGMGGDEVYKGLKDINPDVKVILSSGYSMNGRAEEMMSRGCKGFIQKPFNIYQISRKIRAILDRE